MSIAAAQALQYWTDRTEQAEAKPAGRFQRHKAYDPDYLDAVYDIWALHRDKKITADQVWQMLKRERRR